MLGTVKLGPELMPRLPIRSPGIHRSPAAGAPCDLSPFLSRLTVPTCTTTLSPHLMARFSESDFKCGLWAEEPLCPGSPLPRRSGKEGVLLETPTHIWETSGIWPDAGGSSASSPGAPGVSLCDLNEASAPLWAQELHLAPDVVGLCVPQQCNVLKRQDSAPRLL